jgi:carboxyl-terminal processing protease
MARAAMAEEPTTPGEAARGLADAVLDNSLDPPTRQQMYLEGIKALCKAVQAARQDSAKESGGKEPAEPKPVAIDALSVALPEGLAARVSSAATPEQFDALLAETWKQIGEGKPWDRDFQLAFLKGMVSGLGDADIMGTNESKVAEQFAGNVYVGLHIQLSFDEETKRPTIGGVIPGGPADRAGVQKGDQIEAVDGVATEGMSTTDVADRIRGPLGSNVTLRLKRGAAGEIHTLTATRGLNPRETITGVRKTDKTWSFQLGDRKSIGYLRIDSITGSTPRELRQSASRIEEEGIRALVIDLRELSGSPFHPTVLLADCLLDGGAMGRVRTSRGVRVIEAQPDALFREMPLAVIVNKQTSGAAVWLCAALQDRKRAVLFGATTGEATDVMETIALPGGKWSVELAAGRLERADGRPLSDPESPFSDLDAALGADLRLLTSTMKQFRAQLKDAAPGFRYKMPADREPLGVVPDIRVFAASTIGIRDHGSALRPNRRHSTRTPT